MASWLRAQGHTGVQNKAWPIIVVLWAVAIKSLGELVQLPSNTAAGSNSDAIPMPIKAKKNSMTRSWKRQIMNPFCLLMPQMPMTEPKMRTRSKASRTANNVYWLNERAALVNAQIVTPSIASPTTKIKKAPRPVNPFITLIMALALKIYIIDKLMCYRYEYEC